MLNPQAPALAIRTLGAFHITRDGRPLPATAWPSPKGPELLKILITQRGPVARKQLIELLWPEPDPAVAGNRLSMLLITAHQLLHPQGSAGPLATDGSEVWLDRARVILDVDAFLTHAAAALHAHRTNHPESTTLLHAALAAHTGDFLPDDAHQDWAIPLADEVKFTHIALLQALVTHQR
jgi:DNA-binding SARP family transcriptional activator